jgi:DNA (cytosine-5)-methyltransferase 1
MERLALRPSLEAMDGDNELGLFYQGEAEDSVDPLSLPEELLESSFMLREAIQTTDSEVDISDTISSNSSEYASTRVKRRRREETTTAPQVRDEDGRHVGYELPESSSWPPTKTKSFSVTLPSSTLLYPRSLHEGFEPPAPLESERIALDSLLKAYSSRPSATDEDFIEFDLDNFTVYGSDGYCKLEMKPLQWLCTRTSHERLYFDGMLSFGGLSYFVRKVEFDELPLGNYGPANHSVDDQIWVRSRFNHKADVYYKLRSPAAEYARFWRGSRWLFDFAKHFVDYLAIMRESGRYVSLHQFKSAFNSWLQKTHGMSAVFRQWRHEYQNTDFRVAVVMNSQFLWKESYGVLHQRETRCHPIWKEMLFDPKVPMYELCPPLSEKVAIAHRATGENGEKIAMINPTIVTPYIHECFSHLPFHDVLKSVRLSKETDDLRSAVIQGNTSDLTSRIHGSPKELLVPSQKDTQRQRMIERIKPGDTISTKRDGDGTDTKWRRELAFGCNDVDTWFGLVQDVHALRNGRRAFHVLWFYRPVDTPCGRMKYPWNNELFLSDHCSKCSEEPRVPADEVSGVHDVEWSGSPDTKAEFFCRQTYMIEDRHWKTFSEIHMKCEECEGKEHKPRYQIGDTVLVQLSQTSDDLIEPCEVVRLYNTSPTKRSSENRVELRQLLRRFRVDPKCPDAKPNELVYSNHLIDKREELLVRKCIVRLFGVGDKIPSPYNRNGVGNFFFMTHCQVTVGVQQRYMPIKEPLTMRQGFDPSKPVPRLRGLDLFCGGGNFGRGLEEGGTVVVHWANDLNVTAIHTYMANVDSRDNVHPFLGSIDDMQLLAIQGKFSDNVPRIGDVDFISAGSPCPGFSNLTNDKTTPNQKKNQSLVAAFASFIDLYRPKYGLLENVPGIVASSEKGRASDVFSQLICAIVGLGYQTRFFQLDSWLYGNAQTRTRVFLCFSAPGIPLPQAPRPSHTHPRVTNKRTGFGKLANGQKMHVRRHELAAFKYVTAEEATMDLPDIGDSKADFCIPFPDHRSPVGLTASLRSQISHIPLQPWGMNFVRTWNEGHGIITAAERKDYPEKTFRVGKDSQSWGRVRPKQPFSSITCSVQPTDWKVGRQLHWNQYKRTVSVMECRRAQGFLDHEVILGGHPRDQIRIIGNSVAREVSVALGLAFREAWLGSLHDDEPRPEAVRFAAQRDVAVPIDWPTRKEVSEDPTSATSAANSDSEVDGRIYATPETGISEATDGKTASSSSATKKRPRPLTSSTTIVEFVCKVRKADKNGSLYSSQVPTPLRESITAIEGDEVDDCEI